MSTDAPDLPTAQRELQRLFDETNELVGQGLDESSFFAGLLTRLLQSLAGISGAAWLCEQKSLRPACVAGWDQTGLASKPELAQWHDAMLQRCLEEGGELCVAGPARSTDNGQPAGTSPWTIYLMPIKFRQDVWGVLEVFQRPDIVSSVQRNQLAFMQKYAAIAGMYLIQHKLSRSSSDERLWNHWQNHAYRVAERLDLKHTAAAIANESRFLTSCDRASLVVRRGGKLRLAAASGLEEIDKRAATVSALERLAKAVCASGEPLLAESGSGELPATAEEELKACLDLTHAKTVVVLPLIRRIEDPLEGPEPNRQKAPQPIGALILEQIGESVPARELLNRLGPTTKHSTAALANSLAHEGIFLLPVWRALGQGLAWLRVRTLPKVAAIVGGLLLLVGLLCFYPAELEVEARGSLQPVRRREVFAEVDGELVEVRVRHDDEVEAGQVLAVLRNVELEMKRAGLDGEHSASLERLTGIETMLLTNKDLPKTEQFRLNGEKQVLQASLANADRQIELLQRKRSQLQIRSPIAGRVLTWNVQDTLLHRPVKRGDALLSIADTAGAWELEVKLPEDRLGHVMAAQSEAAGQPLVVRYVIANHPDAVLQGTLREVHRRAESAPSEGNTVLLDVSIDRSQIADLRPGAEATARVQCGRRSLGYVWFHDVWAFLQTKVFFRWF